MSSLLEHARRELQLAGLFDSSSDYGGMLGTSIMALIEKFSDEGHSGYSAAQTIRIFARLADFKNLTPLTRDPGEWMEVEAGATWQSTRNSEAFSRDGGASYYLADEVCDVYGCERCSCAYSTRHPWTPDPADTCSCGGGFVLKRSGKTEAAATRESKGV